MPKTRVVRIAIVAPVSPLQSTLHGLVEFFEQATQLSDQLAEAAAQRAPGGQRRSALRPRSHSSVVRFETTVLAPVPLPFAAGTRSAHYKHDSPPRTCFDAVIASPAYGPPQADPIPDPLLRFLQRQKDHGSWLTSVCAGAFLLGAAGLLDGHRVTTHWALAKALQAACPHAQVDANELVIEDGQLMTAAGTTAWLDLALHMAARLGSAQLATLLGKFYLADTAPREQRCYRVFTPKRDHGSSSIAEIQVHIDDHYARPTAVEHLARVAGMSLRNFQRVSRKRPAWVHSPISGAYGYRKLVKSWRLPASASSRSSTTWATPMHPPFAKRSKTRRD